MTVRRHLGGEVRATSTEGAHTVALRAIRPGVVDDYGSVWMADAFDETLRERLPVLAWSHNWSEPIGVGLSFTPTPEGPIVTCRFDDFDAVPRAAQAFHQVSSVPPTIRDCSVGFSEVQRRDPTDAERAEWPGVVEVITRARMDELSLVLAGAVPGAEVMAVRMANDDAHVGREAAAALLAKVATGELTLTEALVSLEGLPEVDPGEADGEQGEDDGAAGAGEDTAGDQAGDEDGQGGEAAPPDVEVDDLLAEITDVLADLEV